MLSHNWMGERDLGVRRDEFEITVIKVRKLLITGGVYSTALSRKVQKEIEQSREFRIETTGLYVYNRICYRG